jgi:N utilization substance protein A
MNLMEVIAEIGRSKDIDVDSVIRATEEAIAAAARKYYQNGETFVAMLNREHGGIDIYAEKIVTDSLEDASIEVAVEEAQAIDPDAKPGDKLLFPRSLEGFGRIAAQTAKQVVYQRVREAERMTIYERYAQDIGKILNGVVRRVEHGNVVVTLGRTEAVLPRRFQVRGEGYAPGDRVRAVIVDVEQMSKGPQIVLSRTDPRLVSELFAMEVPEIQDKIVRIRGVAREPGERSKVAVESSDADIDPVGACVGMKGYRVQNIIRELNGEKVDIIPYSSDLATYVRNCLSPARISKMSVSDREGKRLEVVVPEDQLSLAIGRNGQNVRLATKLAGWHIDIKSDEAKSQEVAARMAAMSAPASGSDAIEELPGVGPALARTLREAGLSTFTAIAEAPDETLTSLPGIGASTAAKIRASAQAALRPERSKDSGTEAPETAASEAVPAASGGEASPPAPEAQTATEEQK